ncbi:MAG: DUF1345 domain-containing protein [Nevskia sp.]
MSASRVKRRRHWAHRIPVLGPVALVRPRWSIAVLVGAIAYGLLGHYAAPIRLIAAWDTASLVFLVSTIVMALRASPASMRRRARITDQGAVTVLLLTLAGVSACLLTIITASQEVKRFAGGKELAALMVAATVILTWLVLQCSFALHYAHLYYGDPDNDGKDSGGLDFPSESEPDYLDFAYFSFVLGMTFQVSDVAIRDRGLRRLSLLHGMISFFFSTVIVALTINLLAGLAQP